MFCFLQLPYHPKSTVHIALKDRAESKRLFQYYSTEMTAEVMEVTRRNLGEMGQKERRMLFRRSHSEPVNFANEGITMTSRTDPEWNMTVDSISLQSSFVEYQQKRRERFRKQSEHKQSEISASSEASDMDMEHHQNFDDIGQFPDIQMPSTLSLTESDDDNLSNEISSSQAKEINYEDEIRLFIEKNGHLMTNAFADPFDSDERKSRTEQWVKKSTENLAENGEDEDEKVGVSTEDDEVTGFNQELVDLEGIEVEKGGKKEEDIGNGEDNQEETDKVIEVAVEENGSWNKPEMTHQSTEDSLLSSNVTVSSLKKSSYQVNLKEAIEAQSEIDVNDVDRFWDYLYEKEGVAEKVSPLPLGLFDAPSTSESARSLGHELTVSPIKIEFAGIRTPETPNKMIIEKEKEEKDRELDEVLEVHDQTLEAKKFFSLEKSEEDVGQPTPLLMRTTASQTPLPMSSEFVKKSEGKENMIREISFKFSDALFKDLKILLVERDRAREAMEILPAKSTKELSEECNYFQTRYRVRIEQNKEKLDRRIDEVWKKLLKMPIESQEIVAFISVAHSEQLTVNARRNLPDLMRQ